ncbi:MAG TPA: hypothetical protein P5181_05210 [Dermatophilaceae bacterium]|nr:hypothetical protein [Dermatophilaceae bacterium]
MTLYATDPVRRGRQLVGDVAVLLWVAVWVIASRLVFGLVKALGAPAEAIGGAGGTFARTMQDAAGSVGSLPVVGGPLGEVFRNAAGPGTTVAAAGTQLTTTLDRLAWVLALLLALGPTLAVVAPWLRSRIRFARDAAAVRSMLLDGGDLQVFAVRALTTAPPRALARLGPGLVRRLTTGDDETVAALARLELARLGIAMPKPRPARQSGRRGPTDS